MIRETLGLKKLGRLDWIAKQQRKTRERFDAVLTLTRGQRVGRLRLPNGIDSQFAVAVLKLHGYEAEARDECVLFAALEAVNAA